MIITKKAISRRTVLRGMGVSLALPLLDGMVPAFAGAANEAKRPIRRLGVIYSPNGMVLQNWTPKDAGVAYEVSPILQPLNPFRKDVLVLSGLSCREADSKGDGGGDHSRAGGGYLTSVHVKKSEGLVQAGVSMDQIAARSLEKETQFGSLELGLDSNDMVGSCDTGYSCAYSNAIAWRNETMPLPIENNPRQVFERLFGSTDSTDARVRLTRLRQNRSLLDAVLQNVSELQRDLGATDRTKVADYLEAVRDVERRIQIAEEQSGKELPTIDRPAGIPDTFDQHAKLMFDLQVLAYQTDLTRVITFMLGREQSPRTYPQIGVADAWHGLSHHADDPQKLEKLTKIQTYHVDLFSYYLRKLQSTPDGDGSLLDHVMILYGAGLGNSDRHTHFDLPTLLVGGGAGALKGGRHIKYELDKDIPLANLHLTLLDRLGVQVEHFGDSSGRLVELSEISSTAA